MYLLLCKLIKVRIFFQLCTLYFKELCRKNSLRKKSSLVNANKILKEEKMHVVFLHNILIVTIIVAKVIKCKAFLARNAILVLSAKLIFSITKIGTTRLVLNSCRRHTTLTKLFYQGREK